MSKAIILNLKELKVWGFHVNRLLKRKVQYIFTFNTVKPNGMNEDFSLVLIINLTFMFICLFICIFLAVYMIGFDMPSNFVEVYSLMV